MLNVADWIVGLRFISINWLASARAMENSSFSSSMQSYSEPLTEEQEMAVYRNIKMVRLRKTFEQEFARIASLAEEISWICCRICKTFRKPRTTLIKESKVYKKKCASRLLWWMQLNQKLQRAVRINMYSQRPKVRECISAMRETSIAKFATFSSWNNIKYLIGDL